MGHQTLFNNTSGYSNTATGYNALYSNTTGYYNTSSGYASLYFNTTGYNNAATGYGALYLNTTGNYNTANGFDALFSNKTGFQNEANGGFTLYNNTTGNYNAANGHGALYSNTTGYNNTGNGVAALYFNTTGYSNVAIGTHALYSNIDASNNVAVGDSALYNFIGRRGNFMLEDYSNTAIGSKALYSNTTGYSNTAIGFQALYNDLEGAYNTAIGEFALSNNGNFENTAIGENAGGNGNFYMNSCAFGSGPVFTASNQVRVGNTSTTSIGGYVGWSNISDGRVKQNIKQNVPVLAFINKLQPITYNLNLDAIDKIIHAPVHKDAKGNVIQPTQQELTSRKGKEQISYTGFIAQDVEASAKSLDYDFSGVDAAKNSKDLYGLRYAEFVVPRVKAVQELSNMNKSKDTIISQQQNQINNLEARLSKIESMMNTPSLNTSLSSAYLQQNVPNPFSHSTTIGYVLPQQYSSAQILITDKVGSTIKAINIYGNRNCNITVQTSALSSGAYQYSLILDGRIIDTKQMILAK